MTAAVPAFGRLLLIADEPASAAVGLSTDLKQVQTGQKQLLRKQVLVGHCHLLPVTNYGSYMRHLVDERKLGRTSAHRRAMLANMATSLILHDRLETTLPKAKELRRIADRLVSLGKQKDLHARRLAASVVRDRRAVSKLFSDLAKRFASRTGGYTRIYKLGWRHGDSAPMAVIEYLDAVRPPPPEGDKKAKGKGKKVAKDTQKEPQGVPEEKKAAGKVEKEEGPKKKRAGGAFARLKATITGKKNKGHL